VWRNGRPRLRPRCAAAADLFRSPSGPWWTPRATSSSARVFRLAASRQAISAGRPSSSRRRTTIWSVKIPAATRSATCMAAGDRFAHEYAKAEREHQADQRRADLSVIMVLRASTTAASASVRKAEAVGRDHFHKSSSAAAASPALLRRGRRLPEIRLLRRPEA